MKRLPFMSKTELFNWNQKIKVIVSHNGNLMYLRDLSEDEITSGNLFTLANESTELVDLSSLSILADVKMLHAIARKSIFFPTFSEIIRQIPKDIISKTIAFEIIYSPVGREDENLFSEDWNEGFHVSVVRLYQKKDDFNSEASHPICYPSPDINIPIEMSLEEFNAWINCR